MKGGYQILDLKGVDLGTLNGTTKVINLTDEEVKGLKSGKPILLTNINIDNDLIPSAYVVNDTINKQLCFVSYYIYILDYNLENKIIKVLTTLYPSDFNLPSLPETTEDKTYTLKYVEGILTWVEDVVEDNQD